ncbi:MAG TPA: multidrug effflux MFS transporter [Arenibaculum sp.]|nr:multidrug effflux MFS transporter [Arenibaculum sp.]
MTSHTSAPSPAAVRPPSVAILVAVTAIGPLALNIFVPSMPGLMAAFGTSYAKAQLTLTLYLIGIAVGQLLYGPLSDRFGRRPVLLGGLGIYVAASALCAAAASVDLLIAGRIAQAVGGCAGMVLSRAIVRDVHGRDRSASVLAYVTMAMAVAPAVAPAIGGFLDEWFGWRAGFVLTTACGAVVLVWSLFALRETNHDLQPLPGIGGMAASFASLLREPAFLGYALNTAFTTAIFFGFLAGAPYVMSALLHQPPSAYGTLFIMISLGYMLGSFLAARLSVRFGTERMVAAGTLLALGGVLTLGTVLLVAGLSPLGLFAPMVIMAIGNGISMPNGIAAAISVRPRAAGAASGLLGFLQMGVGAVSTVAVGYLKGDSAMPMVAVMLVWALAAIAMFVLAVHTRRPAPVAAAAE